MPRIRVESNKHVTSNRSSSVIHADVPLYKDATTSFEGVFDTLIKPTIPPAIQNAIEGGASYRMWELDKIATIPKPMRPTYENVLQSLYRELFFGEGSKAKGTRFILNTDEDVDGLVRRAVERSGVPDDSFDVSQFLSTYREALKPKALSKVCWDMRGKVDGPIKEYLRKIKYSAEGVHLLSGSGDTATGFDFSGIPLGEQEQIKNTAKGVMSFFGGFIFNLFKGSIPSVQDSVRENIEAICSVISPYIDESVIEFIKKSRFIEDTVSLLQRNLDDVDKVNRESKAGNKRLYKEVELLVASDLDLDFVYKGASISFEIPMYNMLKLVLGDGYVIPIEAESGVYNLRELSAAFVFETADVHMEQIDKDLPYGMNLSFGCIV